MLPKMMYLTVKANPWRNEAVEQRFKEAGLDVERFDGIHGQTVGIIPYNTVYDVEKEHSYRINQGKLSITISKLLVWQHALDVVPDDEPVIIFENDVTFVPNFKEELAKTIAALPADWQVCHLGHLCTDKKPRTIINDRIHEVHWPLACHAVMWKKSALRLAIDVFKSSDYGTPSDIILQHKVFPKLRHYCAVPAIAFTDQTPGEAGNTVYWTDVIGWFDWQQIYDEQLTGFGMNQAVMVEVGTFKGRSAIYLASEIKRRHKNVDLFCVDHWLGNADEPNMAEMIKDANARGGLYKEFIENINRCGVADYIKPLRMSSVEGAAQFKDRSVHFVFIDAGHSYADVSADLRAWYPKMHPGGSMAGHDIGSDDVRRAVRDFAKSIGKTHREWENCWILDGAHV